MYDKELSQPAGIRAGKNISFSTLRRNLDAVVRQGFPCLQDLVSARRLEALKAFFSAVPSYMGLAIVYGIVNNYSGAIRVESAAGVGTTVEVVFPVADEIPAGDAEARGA